VADTLASSYLHLISVSSGSAAEGAASRKITKYDAIATTGYCVPMAFETFGPICDSGLPLFDDLGRRLAAVTGDPKELFSLPAPFCSNSARQCHLFL